VNRLIIQLLPLLLMPAASAVIGFTLGRLIRGCRPKLDARYPRLAMSSIYLQDAHNSALSQQTRMRCAFESIYFCCLEVVVARGLDVTKMGHPSADVMHAGLASMGASADESATTELLAEWAHETSPRLPCITVREACRVATSVDRKAIGLLS
jgi:hypothetical protein